VCQRTDDPWIAAYSADIDAWCKPDRRIDGNHHWFATGNVGSPLRDVIRAGAQSLVCRFEFTWRIQS
jgi:hypothetical protein